MNLTWSFRRPTASAAFPAAIAWVIGLALVAGDAGATQRIVNGVNTQDFPTTGALLHSGGAAINGNNAGTQCSGTLVGCGTFLTAAHCVEGDLVASHYWVYLQHGGIHAVSSIAVHPGYNGLSGNDIAILHLAADVTGIDPTTLNTTHDLNAMGVGLAGEIAGFGQTSGSGNDYGVKRRGDVVTANCDTGETTGEGNDKLVCWNYESPVGAPGTDSNTCNGDSGGPLFMDFGGVTEIVGVTSAGSSLDCLPTDHSWDASVYYNRAWITGQLGGDSTATCGGLPPVGHVDVTVHQNSGSLGGGNPDDAFEVNLTGAPQLVRFTLNGTDNGTFNPNFFVKQGSGASAASFDCKADGASMYGACEFATPTAGTWSVFVQRAGGSGEYQVTTTVFGGDPPVCGNDVVEYGEDCDGTDDAACPGQCNGSCECPPPVCGNDVAESGEACDGTDDAACPGQCQGDCTCPAPACSSGDLYGLRFRSDARRFSYKGLLFDDVAAYRDLDPRDTDFALHVVDVGGSVDLAIPASDAGWTKADPVRRKYAWRGDGTLDGLRRVTLKYRVTPLQSYWILNFRGRDVPGGGDIDPGNVLDFELGFDGTCHRESW